MKQTDIMRSGRRQALQKGLRRAPGTTRSAGILIALLWVRLGWAAALGILKKRRAIGSTAASIGCAVLCLLAAPVANAASIAQAGTCTISMTGVVYSIPAINVTIPPGVTAGTVIYTGNNLVPQGGQISINCTATSLSNPAFASLVVQTGTLVSGMSNVYSTSIPGIGVSFTGSTTGAVGLSFSSGSYSGVISASSVGTGTLTFVVTNPALITTGTYNLAAAGLPTFVPVLTAASFGGTLPPVYNYTGTGSIGGTLNIVSSTCTTNNVNVSLGTHASGEFSGVGAATTWVPFSIPLTNCPAFYGSSVTYTASSATTSITPNAIGVTLTPVGDSPVIGASTSGTIAITPASAGATASGIGIQIANSSGTPETIDGATINPSGLALTSAAGGNYNIPMEARYIQTDSTVQPGQANGSIIFTINYQ